MNPHVVSVISGHEAEHRVVYFAACGKYLQSVVEKMIQDHGDSPGGLIFCWLTLPGGVRPRNCCSTLPCHEGRNLLH